MFVIDKLIFSTLFNFLNIEGVPIGLTVILGAIALALPPHNNKKVRK